MATATELVRDCRICAATFKNPKLLPCHHTFCGACVKTLTKRNRLVCPNCRKECHARDIVPDFRLGEFLEALREQEVKLKPAKTETVAMGISKCEFCGEKCIAYYCKDCDQLICISCKKIHQNANVLKQHRIESVASKNKQIKTLLRTELRTLRNIVTNNESIVSSFQIETDKTKAIQIRTLDESKRLREKLHHEIDERLDAFDSEVLDKTVSHMARLAREQEQYVRTIRGYESQCAHVEKYINDDSHLAMNGNSILERMETITRSAQHPSVNFRSIDFHLRLDDSWDISKTVTLSVKRGNFNFAEGNESEHSAFSQVGRHNRITPTYSPDPSGGLESVSTTPWIREHSVSISRCSHCLCLIHGELWQCHGRAITVYDAALQELRTINSGHVACIYDVALLPSGEVVVAAKNGLFQMTVTGELIDEIANGSFTAVVQHAGCVYAFKDSTRTVYSYQHSNGWTQRHSFLVNETHGTTTLGVSRDLLYACSLRDNRIDVFSLSGKHQFSAGSKGSFAAGLLASPFISATDADGADAVIADCCNDRLQVLSAGRQWRHVSLWPPVKRPHSAVFLQGRLYVNRTGSLQEDGTLHIYEPNRGSSSSGNSGKGWYQYTRE